MATKCLELLEVSDAKELGLRQPALEHLQLLKRRSRPPEMMLSIPAGLLERGPLLEQRAIRLDRCRPFSPSLASGKSVSLKG